jgi:hypothetical protein
MAALSTSIVDHEKVGELGLCPICKINYITEDETVCSTCYAETDLTDEEISALYAGKERPEDATEDDTEDDDELTVVEDDETDLGDEDLELLNVAGIDNEEQEPTEEEEEKDDDDDIIDDPLADLDEDGIDDEDDDEDDDYEDDEEDDK